MHRTENQLFVPVAGGDIFKQMCQRGGKSETEVRIRRKLKVSSKSTKSEDRNTDRMGLKDPLGGREVESYQLQKRRAQKDRDGQLKVPQWDQFAPSTDQISRADCFP